MNPALRNALLCLLIPFAGCARKGLQGKWHGTTSRIGVTANVDMDFKDNNRFSKHITAQGPRGSIDFQEDGAYKVEGESVATMPTGGSVNGKPIPSNGRQFRDPDKIHVDGDTMTLVGRADTIILNRVK